MIARRTLFAALFASAAMSPMGFVWAADQSGDPNEWVLEMSNKILDMIRADEKLQAGDSARIRVFVDDIVMPTVDFLRMTRMCVGPKWRGASAEQREELQKLFRDQLIRVYSGALATVKGQKTKLAPNRVKPTEKDALVRTLLFETGKPDIRLDYRLKKVEGLWRIVDVNVEGIWLVDNYRNQFSSVVNSSGIEGLIQELKNKNLEAKNQ